MNEKNKTMSTSNNAMDLSLTGEVTTSLGQSSYRRHAHTLELDGSDQPEQPQRDRTDATAASVDGGGGGVSEAMVSALSSSLACIAATGNEERARVKAQFVSQRRVEITAPVKQEGGSASSLSGSSSARKSEDRGVATATSMTTSSGDDRDSTAAFQGSSATTTNSSNKSSSGDDSLELRNEARAAAPTFAALEEHQHYHLLQLRNQLKRPPTDETRAADAYGLPISLNERVQATENALTHRTVFAHLPPPSIEASSSAGSGAESERKSRREKGFHEIRHTFSKLARKEARSPDKSQSSILPRKYKKLLKRRPNPTLSSKEVKAQKRKIQSRLDDEDYSIESNSSSGSSTDSGYAASSSSNEQESCSSLFVSSKDSVSKRRRTRTPGASSGSMGPMNTTSRQESLSVSSELADFSSGNSQEDIAADWSTSESLSRSASASSLNRQQDQSLDVKPRAQANKIVTEPGLLLEGTTPILGLGCDIMAHILTFLQPPDALEVLTMPLSKDWLSTFTRQPELWRVLCLLHPFKADVAEEDDVSSNDSLDSFPDLEQELLQTLGKSRLLYTSFVRCIRYLARIEDDALHGRSPTNIDFGTTIAASHNINANDNLKNFLARARGVVVGDEAIDASSDISDDGDDNNNNGQGLARRQSVTANPIGVSDVVNVNVAAHSRKRGNGSEDSDPKKRRKTNLAPSDITSRLLGSTSHGERGYQELPWSCAIYSIVNWMVSFSDVEGIQVMCLKVLPRLLENEQQRSTAQRAGLTDIVLRTMVLFPDNAQLHTAAFHTIVLLARPLGGREGMLFHTSMVNSSGIFNANQGDQDGKSGVAVMLDSMRRFENDEVLQAMSCWSLVNIALAPAQKEVLVKLGGIEVTANAMMAHPFNAEVQFRALFALINLVIPSVSPASEGDVASTAMSDDGGTERERLDESVDQICGLVVRSMKNFCSSEAILNRACLVLHNLSLTQEYHSALLSTPNCYQMLEWCLGNYLTDQVLQQSAAGTLHRLQMTLSSNKTLLARFTASLEAQHQLSLEQAHAEAVVLRERQLREAAQREQLCIESPGLL